MIFTKQLIHIDMIKNYSIQKKRQCTVQNKHLNNNIQKRQLITSSTKMYKLIYKKKIKKMKSAKHHLCCLFFFDLQILITPQVSSKTFLIYQIVYASLYDCTILYSTTPLPPPPSLVNTIVCITIFALYFPNY